MGSVSYQVMPSSNNTSGKRKFNSAMARVVPVIFVIAAIAYLVFADPLQLFNREEEPITESPLALLEQRLANSILNVETTLTLAMKNKIEPLAEQSTKFEQTLRDGFTKELAEAEKRILQNVVQAESIKELIREELKVQLADALKTLAELKEQVQKLEQLLKSNVTEQKKVEEVVAEVQGKEEKTSEVKEAAPEKVKEEEKFQVPEAKP